MNRALRTLGLVGWMALACCPLYAANPPAPVVQSSTNFIDPEITGDNPQVKQLMEAVKKQGVSTDSLLDAHFLFASLIWGAIGSGYLIYARKQREIVPFIGGVAMIAGSCFIGSWFWMSVICLALMVGVYQLMKQGCLI